MQPATSPRRATALCSAAVANRDFIRESMRVADDPVGEHVLDRAQVELAFPGAMLSNIAEPQLIWRIGGEVALDQIIVHRRADLAVLAALLAEHAPPPIVWYRSATRCARPSARRQSRASSTR